MNEAPTPGPLAALGELLKSPEILKEIYGDLAKPGVQQVGQAFGTVFGYGNTLLLRLQLASAKGRILYERNLEKFRQEMLSVPMDQVTPVPPEIGVPVMEKLGYTTDEELSQMYVNLLAKAADSAFCAQAHPSFINTISSLSPDEAVFLKLWSKRRSLPFIRAKWYIKGTKIWASPRDLLIPPDTVRNLKFPENSTVYIGNLQGLGVLNLSRTEFVAPADVYDELINQYTPILHDTTPNIKREDHELKFEKGRIDLTAFGNMFVKACVEKTPRGNAASHPE